MRAALLSSFVFSLSILHLAAGGPIENVPRAATDISPLQCAIQNPTVPVQCCQLVEPVRPGSIRLSGGILIQISILVFDFGRNLDPIAQCSWHTDTRARRYRCT